MLDNMPSPAIRLVPLAYLTSVIVIGLQLINLFSVFVSEEFDPMLEVISAEDVKSKPKYKRHLNTSKQAKTPWG